MKSGQDHIKNILLIILVSFGLISGIINYFRNPSLYLIPLIFAILIIFIYLIFEIREFYNKKIYFIVLSILLIIMWTVSLIQLLLPNVDEMVSIKIFCIEIFLVTLLFMISIPFTFKKWNKLKNH